MKPFSQLVITSTLVLGFFSAMSQKDQNAAMKAWTAFMTPGDVHKMIAQSDGVWTTEMSLWMEPGGQPMVSKGVCTNKMILGGRYQESRYQGNFMGMPMEGMGTLAYNNAKKIFESSWVDNMGTSIMFLSGSWDAGTKTINFTGVTTDPATGSDIKVRESLKFIDDKKQVMEMFMSPDGSAEFKSMQISFTRK